LRGTIPESLGSLDVHPDAFNITMTGNSLYGTLPSTFGQWNSSLVRVSIGSNIFTGSFPEAMTRSKTMWFLYVLHKCIECLATLLVLIDGINAICDRYANNNNFTYADAQLFQSTILKELYANSHCLPLMALYCTTDS
jgi:hypothetical protein